MKKSLIYTLLLLILPMGLFAQTRTVGTTGADYATLRAAFNAINAGTLSGAITLQIINNTTESAAAVLNASGTGSANYTAVDIYPTASGIVISGNLATPLIDLNGADNITINGSVNGSGSSIDMTITNTSTSATSGTSTIRLRNDANSNTIKNCILKGSETVASSGILLFSTTTGTTGNDGNTIDNNNITSSADVSRPINAIYSAGTATFENSENIIINNNIYDNLNRGVSSQGIYLGANNSGWTISGNSFYETAPFIPTLSVSYYIIRISNTGVNYTVTGNFIGGNATLCGGSAWTKTNSFNNIFYGIYLNSGTAAASNIQNNTIRNIDWSNSLNGAWSAIHIAAGPAAITGNNIGSDTGTGSITVTADTTGNNIYGINIASPGDVDCQNNTIGSITVANNDAYACNFYAINKSNSAGTTIISNNKIGSESTANSINASSGSNGTLNAQTVRGIYNTGNGDVTISNNRIANLTNGTTNATAATLGRINGIYSTSGTTTIISGNNIHDLTIANANNLTTINASITGICLSGISAKTITGNTIYNLSNSYASFTGCVIGLYFTGSTSGNKVSENFIHSLSVSPSSSAAFIYGIKMSAGASTYSNNIISLCGDTPTTVYGIYETGLADNDNNLYFNTVHIGGSPSSGVNRSYALYSAVNTNIRDFRNNIFSNTRSTTGGANLHYAVYIVSTGGTITSNFNDYWVSGTGGIIGYFGGTKTVLPIVTGQDVNSQSTDPLFPQICGTAATDYIPLNCTLVGTPLAGITNDYEGTTRDLKTPSMGVFEREICLGVDVYKANVLQASYPHLKDAFDSINSGFHNTGAFEIRINRSITEINPDVLNASGTGSANYNSVIIYPTAPGITISGNFNAPLIDLNGANNVTIDGRVNIAGSGKDMTIINTSTAAIAGTSTVRMRNGASKNSIKYCILKGSEMFATSGILLFDISAGTTGNNDNIIDNNDITSSTDATRPLNVIYSAGTASHGNNGNAISNNNIYDHLNKGIASNGIYLVANNSAWTISGNSFYETASFAPTANVTYYLIRINNTGVNYSVSGNFIGGSASSCGNLPLTKTNAFYNIFYGIYLKAGTGVASNILHNTVKNISWSNSANGNWTGIYIAGGEVNVGNAAVNNGNIIGGASGRDSVVVTCATSGNNVYGINISGPGNVNCLNNKIGAITVANIDANGSNFYGIYKSNSTGIAIISNNIIGNATTANSINVSSPSTVSAQSVRGIYNAGSGAITINDNTIANLNNGTTNSDPSIISKINGIFSQSGTQNTISGNLIHDLTIACANSQSGLNASVCGISLSGPVLRTLTGNTIYNLSNTYATNAGYISGLYFTGSGSGNIISRNFIHSLSVNSSSATIYGIQISTGGSDYYNNIIALGGNTGKALYGIYETGATETDNNLYFNTVYIGGAPTSGSSPSYALYSSSDLNTRNFRNNLFVNARSNNGATGTNYAIRLSGITDLTIDYNDYYAPGTGGMLGTLAGNKSTLLAWQTATTQDANSLNIDPLFVNAGGVSAADYVPRASLPGVDGTDITTDFDLITRSIIPTMGAWEGIFNSTWKGGISEDWGTPGNWSGGIIPAPDASIAFDPSPLHNLRMDADRSVDNIINTTTWQLITNGHKLTLKGGLVFSGGAQIDASATSSVIEFAGPVSQTILPGSFLNDQIYDLTINNNKNLVLNGSLNLLHTLTATSGVLDASTVYSTLIYGGTTAQTIADSAILNDRLNNLTIDNVAGVSLNMNFTVDSLLTINSGRMFIITAPNLLTVPGNITNDAGNSGLILKSDATGEGKLITNSNTSGTVELYLTGGLISPTIGIFHYFIPPVQTMTIGSTIPEVSTNLNLTYFSGDLLSYSEPSAIANRDAGWKYIDGYPAVGSPNFTVLTPASGYNILFTNNDKMTFKGQLNTSSHTFNLNYTPANPVPGWNLIGNPYPCNYNLNGVEGLGTIVPGISNTVYYNNNGNYTYWNVYTNTGSTAGYTDILPPMTGFFVLVTRASSLSLPASSRTSSPADSRSLHKKSSSGGSSKASDIRKVKLVLMSGSKTDETIALLFNDATKSYNEHYDAIKMSDKKSPDPSIFSVLDGVSYFMKAVPVPVIEPEVIPLRVIIKESGTQQIYISEFENLKGIKVILKHGETETQLGSNVSYTFTADAGTYDNFELIFGDKKSTKETDNPVSDKVRTWYRNNYLYLDFSGEINSTDASMIIYDYNGKMVYNNKKLTILPEQTNQIPVRLQSGVYISDFIIDKINYKLKFVVY